MHFLTTVRLFLLYVFFKFLVCILLKGLLDALFLGVIWCDDANTHRLFFLALGMIFPKQLRKQHNQLDLFAITKRTDGSTEICIKSKKSNCS